ncbi:MAG: sigma-70 family RNA polymerase sigma factor [Rubrivivax sp.]|nr:sigma-70 family RNA polymerase sigma factor [Rubrivivax sp.]
MSAASARSLAAVLTLPVRQRRAGAEEEAAERCGEAPDDGLAAVRDDDDGDTLCPGEPAEAFDDEPGVAGAEAGAGAARRAAVEGAAAADDATLAGWIGRIAGQDERALEALYDATAARVNGVVLRIVQRPGLAEEVVEETYWQVWRQAPRFDAARGRPVTWLLSMARSRAIDALRREQRYQHDALPDDDVAEGHEGAAALPPQDLLEATRGHVRVHAALASLEPRARQLVALAFFRGLTHEEIAVQQGMPLGTVKSLIRRALRQLRRVMEAGHA